jgi:hypothetical protein
MAILDSLAEFCDATSVNAAAGTALVGNVMDLGSTTFPRNLGGQPLYLVITVDTAIVTGGAAGKVRFQLASDAQAAIATDGTATVHFQTGEFVTDDAPTIPAGSILACVALPEAAYTAGASDATDKKSYERYLGILVVTTTTTTTAGKINAFLTPDPVQGGRISYSDASN